MTVAGFSSIEESEVGIISDLITTHGLTIQEVADKWELSYSTMQKFCAKHGIIKKGPNEFVKMRSCDFARTGTAFNGTKYFLTKRGCRSYVAIPIEEYEKLKDAANGQ